MKAAFATLCCFLLFQCVRAQKWSLSVDGGASFPTGAFGKKNIYDSTAAFSKVGPAIQLTADRRIDRHWGLSFIVSGEEHAADSKAVVSQLREGDPSRTYTYTQQHWNIGKILIGAFGEWSVEGPWTFTVRGYLGVMGAKYPNFTVAYFDPGQSAGEYSRGYSGAPIPGPVIQLEAGMRYDLGKGLFLRCDLEASAADVSYGNRPSVAAVAGLSNYGASQNAQFVQPIGMFGVTIGVGIRI